MVIDLRVHLKVKVNSLDLTRSVPLTVPRSSPCGNLAAHQECLTANPEAFLARRASEYHTTVSCIHTLTNTQFTGSVHLLLPDVYKITLNIWGGKHIVMLTTTAQNPEHEQTWKQVFQTVSLWYLIQQASNFPNFLLIQWKFHPLCVCSRCAVRATAFQIPNCVGGTDWHPFDFIREQGPSNKAGSGRKGD